MRKHFTNRSGCLRGAILGVIAVLCASCLATPALAQVTIRFEPTLMVFPLGVASAVDVWVDNIPSIDPNTLEEYGLKSFALTLKVNDLNNCLPLTSVTLDPDLSSAWIFPYSNWSQDPNTRVITWNAGTNQVTLRGPSGTIRLGSLTFNPSSAGFCGEGVEGTITWNATNSKYSIKPLTPNLLFSVLEGLPWAVGSFAEADFTVDDCTQLTPADPNGVADPNYVDGDLITLQCTVSNIGTDPGDLAGVLAAISLDDVVTAADTQIGNSSVVFDFQPGASIDVTLSGAPIYSASGLIKFCAMADMSPLLLSIPWGGKLETDETNNTFCIDAQALLPLRDLQHVPVFVDPNEPLNDIPFHVRPGPLASDPNVNPDPNGNPFPAGSTFEIEYTAENVVDPNLLLDPNEPFNPNDPQGGNALVRAHRNTVYIVDNEAAFDDPNTILTVSDPNTGEVTGVGFQICYLDEPVRPGIPGGASITRTYGPFDDIDNPNDDTACGVPFDQPPGQTAIGLALDSKRQVSETDETDNRSRFYVDVGASLPPDLRPAPFDNITNTHTRMLASTWVPVKTEVPISISSAKDLSSYQFTFNWSDPNMIQILDPNVDVVFSDFIEINGRTQTCSVLDYDPNTNTSIEVECTSTGTDIGGRTAGSAEILRIAFDPTAPGFGDFTITNWWTADANGALLGANPTPGTYEVYGFAEVEMINMLVPAGGVVPGTYFQVQYTLDNVGFGDTAVGMRSEVVVSLDDNLNLGEGDTIACFTNETTPIPYFAFRDKMLTNCLISRDIRPGIYKGLFRVLPEDPEPVDLMVQPRLLTLRKDGKNRSLESTLVPSGIGGTTGPAFATTSKFKEKSLAVVKSTQRNRDFLTAFRKPKRGRRLDLLEIPKGVSTDRTLRRHRELRLPGAIRAVLGGADINGDGEDELILKRRLKNGDHQLEFRILDYDIRYPTLCVPAARTSPASDWDPGDPNRVARIVAAAGIQYLDPSSGMPLDGDPDDEIAVVTQDANGDQTLTIYDVEIDPNGPALPAPDTCRRDARIRPPALLNLFEQASSDPSDPFGQTGDRARSMCVMDFDLDGFEDLVGLFVDASGQQALRVFIPPAGPEAEVILVADDDAFGGVAGRSTALSIACMR